MCKGNVLHKPIIIIQNFVCLMRHMLGLRIEHLYRSARYIIENLLQDNTYLAIITFSSTANVTAKARLIASDSDRKYLIDGLPRTVKGSTSIGAGLREVLQHLRAVDLENAEVFLISDGEENTAPFIDDVIDDVKQSHLIVHTISVSQDADIKLKNLAQGTGGRSLTYLETPSITFLDVFSQAVISGHVLPDSSVPVIAGEYFFTIAADWATDVSIYVSSFPIRNTSDVVRVTTWFSGTTIDFTAQNDIILFVSLDQCRLPVINATVFARMDVEGEETIITLGDNGTGNHICYFDIKKKHFIGYTVY
ncbi:hypothetical protein CHS0354_031692 [Potamilus streckersoni]|uniref:VWFA domain-containing protein n=1 Tax=Potamilus streckersoni TaxID=2493646 RepID=A0AAE0SS18_9BIVA|nr:hypothetical protein CHS0354_031692 [Potamilus streckersoni]